MNHTENSCIKVHEGLLWLSIVISFCLRAATGHIERKALCLSLTTAAGILQTCLAGFFHVLSFIPSFIRKINRITVRHWRRDVIGLAHHGRQSVWWQKSSSSLLEYVRLITKYKKNVLLRLTQTSWLHAKSTSLQKQSAEEGQRCTWWWSHVVSPPLPLDLFAFALHFPTHSAWLYGKPHATHHFTISSEFCCTPFFLLHRSLKFKTVITKRYKRFISTESRGLCTASSLPNHDKDT